MCTVTSFYRCGRFHRTTMPLAPTRSQSPKFSLQILQAPAPREASNQQSSTPIHPTLIVPRPRCAVLLRHVLLVVVQAQPALAERAGPRSRPLAPRLRLPRPPRLLRLRIHRRHHQSLSRQPHLRLLRRRRRRPRLRPHPRLAPRAQPLRPPLRCRPRRAHPLLVPRLPRAPRRRLLLLAPDPHPGPTPRPGERPPLRPQLRRALHPRLRVLLVPDADGAARDVGQPRCVGRRAVLPGAVGARHTGARGWAGHPALRADWYCYTTVCMQLAVCSCICHWVELCSDAAARFSSKVDSLKPT